MGLERLVSIVQGGETNYDTDLFLPIIEEIKKSAKYSYEGEYKMAYRVICDHIRTVTFAIADGAIFSNEGRGYVLRRVLRRAIRYNIKLGINQPFIYKLVKVVVNNMQEFYGYLLDKVELIEKQVKKEEESFYITLKNGEKLLNEALKEAKKTNVLSGEVIFKLYDTYGYPKELTFEVASDAGLDIDYEGFEKAMLNQKETARSARNSSESMHNQSEDLLNYHEPFYFSGYTKTVDSGKIIKLIKDGQFVDELEDKGAIILDRSCFYAESGGQCADIGIIKNDTLELKVEDVKKAPNGQFIHFVTINKGQLKTGLDVELIVDAERRKKIMANHSSLHLLQSALIKVLGNHIAQAGSYVCDTYARFDFSHHEKISFSELSQIERLVNEAICAEVAVETKVLALEDAKKEEGVIALFDEKYEDIVRIVCMGDISKEFCGGTHVTNTAHLGSFKIVSEESIGSGIRRIECRTKLEAYDSFKNLEIQLNELKDLLKLKGLSSIKDKIESLIINNQNLLKQNEILNTKISNLEANSILEKAKQHKDIKYLIIEVSNIDNLKEYALLLRDKIKNSVIFIAQRHEQRTNLVCAIDKNVHSINANDIIKNTIALIEGKGGGKADFAMGGGSFKDNFIEIFDLVEKLILKNI